MSPEKHVYCNTKKYIFRAYYPFYIIYKLIYNKNLKKYEDWSLSSVFVIWSKSGSKGPSF